MSGRAWLCRSAGLALVLLSGCAGSAASVVTPGARDERARFRRAVRTFFRDTHPVCAQEPVAATKPGEQNRDRRFAALVDRIEATPMARDLHDALDDAALEQRESAAIADCMMPDGTVDDREIRWAHDSLSASLASLTRIEPAFRAALAKL